MTSSRAAGDVYVEWVEDEAVALNRVSGEVHYLNPTAATVLALIQEHGYERGVAEVTAWFGLEPGDPGLGALLEEMTASGILAGDAPAPAAPSEHGEPRAAPG